MSCALCDEGALLILGRHIRVTRERGVEELGACSATPEEIEVAESNVVPFRAALTAWRERMAKLPNVPPSFIARSEPREPGSDDD
ncbi:MAG TPA: hypothetical protein VMT56_00515 [Candidatus Bathyarchaeia archaeon]|nr:hypothetical protein [Candidatus Bathyarchaeia archaeon]